MKPFKLDIVKPKIFIEINFQTINVKIFYRESTCKII